MDDITKLINTVSEKYGISVSVIMSKKRSKMTVFVRQLIQYYLHIDYFLSYIEIGETIFYCDPDTIKHNVKKINKLMGNNHV